MSFLSSAALAAADPLTFWRRDYGGPLVTVALAERAPLRITPNHPVLTHAGWRRPALLVPGVHAVAADADAVSAEVLYEQARDAHGEHRLPTDASDFRGDGGGYDSHVVCLDETSWPPTRPWVGNEGVDRTPDPAPVQAALDALCTPAEFTLTTWAQACAKVPGLAEAYPAGPVARHGPLDPAVRRRLGSALAALPEVPLDRAALGYDLLGLAAPLRLVEVVAVDIGPSMTVVHDVTTARGIALAEGVAIAA